MNRAADEPAYTVHVWGMTPRGIRIIERRAYTTEAGARRKAEASSAGPRGEAAITRGRSGERVAIYRNGQEAPR